MPTLQIEHSISGFGTWSAAFSRLSERRQHEGVTHERVSRPIDDPHYVVIGLDFRTVEAAQRFREFLQTQIWASSERSPALVGAPRTQILDVVIDH